MTHYSRKVGLHTELISQNQECIVYYALLPKPVDCHRSTSLFITMVYSLYFALAWALPPFQP